VGLRVDEPALGQGPRKVTCGDEDLGITKRLHGSHAEDDSLSRLLCRIYLPIELVEVEFTRRGLDPVPVGTEANHLEG
jgi:hypothetical protein